MDATECRIQKPSNVSDQCFTYSTYKNGNTVKTIIGITPRGTVNYISEFYGGSASDRMIIERSDLVKGDMFSPGESVIADRGILCQDIFYLTGVQCNTPNCLRGKSQLDPDQVIRDRRIALKRIHVERIIGLGKTYEILKCQIPSDLTKMADLITNVCYCLCNFKPSIIKKHC